MSTNGGPGGDRLGIGEIYWYRNDVGEEDRAIEVLSERGELFFYRLRRHYLYRAGTLPYDPSAICTKMGYKTVRPFNAGFQELVTAGLVSVEDGMVRFPHVDRIIADVQANRDKKANDGRTGGEAKAANAKNVQETSANVSPNLDEVSPKPQLGIVQNQGVSSSTITINHSPENKTTSVGSSVNGSGHSVGGGGSDTDKIIADFYRIVGLVWGPERMEAARAYSDNDIAYAGQWLKLAGGNVEVVIKALDEATDHFDRKKGCPSSLGVIKVSMPNKIGEYLDHTPTTAADLRGPGRSNVAAVPTASPGDDIWLRVYTTAQSNGHKDIVRDIDAFIDGKDIAGANNFARSVEAIVNGKKARAAA